MVQQPPSDTSLPENSPAKAPRRRGIVALGAIVSVAALGALITAIAPNHFGLTPSASTSTSSAVNDPTKTGCPAAVAQPTWPNPANETIQESAANSITNAHVGDTLEMHLPAGFRWATLSTVGLGQSLTEQSPGGYFDRADNTCVWRYSVKARGESVLQFTRQMLCLPGKACSPIIITYRFVVQVAG